MNETMLKKAICPTLFHRATITRCRVAPGTYALLLSCSSTRAIQIISQPIAGSGLHDPKSVRTVDPDVSFDCRSNHAVEGTPSLILAPDPLLISLASLRGKFNGCHKLLLLFACLSASSSK
jgi:hypothetical protein